MRRKGVYALPFICVWLAGPALFCHAQSHVDIAEAILRENRQNIVMAAREFGQPPRLLASIIFAERSTNLRVGKSMAEDLAARVGYNSSIGVAQVKVETARWIEKHLGDLSRILSLSAETSRSLAPSRTRGELIQRLMEPSTNLLYAAAYIALITESWTDVLRTPSLQDSRVGIIATLYSLGLELPDGSLRSPHPNPTMNHFGEVAQAFYDGSILREEFPK
jgi:hypothetical protein